MEALTNITGLEADSIIALIKSISHNTSSVEIQNVISDQISKAQKMVNQFEQYLAAKREGIEKLVTFQNVYSNQGTAQNKSPCSNQKYESECTVKNLKYMREFPPPAYTPNEHLYAHLALNVDKYVNAFKFSRADLIHCLYLVFEHSRDTAEWVTKIADKYLPETPASFENRKLAYLKISKALQSVAPTELPLSFKGEKFVDIFRRTRIYLEPDFYGTDSELNERTIRILLNPKHKILPSDKTELLWRNFTILRDFENLDRSVSTARILRFLRNLDHLNLLRTSNSRSHCLNNVDHGILSNENCNSCVSTPNTALVCSICNDSPKFQPHEAQNCPTRGKCVVCTVVRGIDPQQVYHSSSQHRFQPGHPKSPRMSQSSRTFSDRITSHGENWDGRGRPPSNRGNVVSTISGENFDFSSSTRNDPQSRHASKTSTTQPPV